ncbi:MAG: DUF4190 domain-containing protein [Micrococcales bacterium]|nr:DUF4190 domain-containing protein [Micrococcales bacterium]
MSEVPPNPFAVPGLPPDPASAPTPSSDPGRSPYGQPAAGVPAYGTPPTYGAPPTYGPSPYGAPPSDPYRMPPYDPYGMPPYGPPGGAYPPPYGQPYLPHPPLQRTNGLAIAAMAVGITSFLFCTCLVVGIVALVLGIIALNQIKERGDKGKGMAIAGVATGAASLLLGIFFWSIGFMDDFNDGFNDGYYGTQGQTVQVTDASAGFVTA